MPYVSLFRDSMGPGTPVRHIAPIVRAMAYALNSMEGVGCRVVKQHVGSDVPRITIVVDGSSDTPYPDNGVPPYIETAAQAWPIFAADTEGIQYVLARKSAGTIGWLPVTESCPPDTGSPPPE